MRPIQPPPAPSAGAVSDKGDGRFEVTYTVTAAGPVSIAASLPGQPASRLFEAQCEAAGAALDRCTVAAVAEALVAGDTGALVFWQADRCAAAMQCRFLLPLTPGVSTTGNMEVEECVHIQTLQRMASAMAQL